MRQKNSGKLKFSPFWVVLIGAVVLVGILAVLNYQKTDKALEGALLNNENKMTDEQSLNQVVLHTSVGDITIELFKDKAPATVKNFRDLIGKNFYDGVKFHRVIHDFMVQTGDPLSKEDDTSVYGQGGPGYTFPDEINDIKIVRGIVAMANAGPDTNGSQFFIVTAVATPWLDGKHTAFGRVVSGMEVVDRIEDSKVDGNDLPRTPIVVESVDLR